jgi:hypothetical protein
MIPIIALHDSGCSKSIMSKTLFDKLQQIGDAQIYYEPRYQGLKMASGQIQRILGLADIKLNFVGENNCTKSFPLGVIVYEGLEQ